MRIAILKERAEGELRVAASPDSVKKLVALGAEVVIEKGAGKGSAISDDDYKKAGAKLAESPEEALKEAEILLTVQKPVGEMLALAPEGCFLIGMLEPLSKDNDIQAYADRKLIAFSMELIPRISRAQSMDVLSSQSNLAGYRAVIDAVHTFGKAVPMMMTAAGTVPPAKVVVLGAGVAGLQAIATAKRLGASVSAFDVRPAVKEQVESLGASFVEVPPDEGEEAETSGGYAKEMSEAYKQRQQEILREHIKSQDIVITTALIPGRPAPVLIPEDLVKEMKSGAVIFDLAVTAGGNCPLSEADKVVEKHGVNIIGYSNVPGRVAVDASRLYARNLYNFLELLIDKEARALKIDEEDQIVQETLLTRDGKVVNERVAHGG